MTTPNESATTNVSAADIETATRRVRELGEQVAEQARKNGLVWLEGYEAMRRTSSTSRRRPPRAPAPSGPPHWPTRTPTSSAPPPR